jgi:hypothetical protein
MVLGGPEVRVDVLQREQVLPSCSTEDDVRHLEKSFLGMNQSRFATRPHESNRHATQKVFLDFGERRKIGISFGKSSINRGREVIDGNICRVILAEPAKSPSDKLPRAWDQALLLTR